jgi:hypothetical protein
MPAAVEKAGRLLDGSAFAEKSLSRYQTAKTGSGPADLEVRELVDRGGNVSLLISLKEFPAVRLRGSDPLGDGGFYFTRLEYLGGNAAGWNEFTLELSGAGSFARSEGAATLAFSAFPEAVQISSGKIRRNETRITGTEALTSLRHRHERILALTGWMRDRGGPAFQDQKSFDSYWRPLLLPETVSAKKRPPEWKTGGQWVWAEDLRWNVSYTQALLPEELWPLRGSGALLRDWEEALDWIYFEYSRGKLEEYFSGEIILQRVK